ncbi:MAG TPA: lonely Cys domain-containing protein, partial [Streptomyces sp.]|nr:lonely Cys domain-containing protein [Streptomyces sp.]
EEFEVFGEDDTLFEQLASLPPSDLEDATRDVLRLPDGTKVNDADRSRVFWAMVRAGEWFGALPDRDAVAARVLHLEEPDEERTGELFDLAAQAVAAGRDLDDLTELAAFDLEVQGAFDPENRINGADGSQVGLNWSAAAVSRAVDMSRMRRPAPLAGDEGRTVSERALWQKSGLVALVHVVRADKGDEPGHAALTFRTAFGQKATFQAPYAEIAVLLSHNPAFIALPDLGVDIVLAVPTPPAGASVESELGRLVAAATGRRNWTFPGSDMAFANDGPMKSVLAIRPAAGKQGYPDWNTTSPEEALPPEQRGVRDGFGEPDILPLAATSMHTTPSLSTGTPALDELGERATVLPSTPGADHRRSPRRPRRAPTMNSGVASVLDDELLSGSAAPGATAGRVFTAPVAAAPAPSATPTALETLDALRREDERLRGGPLDVEALARRILHIAPDDTVDSGVGAELLTLFDEATAAGRADSVVALAAFHAQQQGVFSAGNRFTELGRVAGVNWMETRTNEIDSAVVDAYKELPDGTMSGPGGSFAPWADGSYLVGARGRHDRVEVPWPDGSVRDLDIDEFVELMAHDPELLKLPKDVPVVLALPHGGDRDRRLPLLLADRLGRDVWSHTGSLSVLENVRQPMTIRVTRFRGRAMGDWLSSPPGRAPDRAADVPDWYGRALTKAVVSASTGKMIGISSFQPDELADDRQQSYRRHDRMKQFAYHNPATLTESLHYELPGADGMSFLVANHGLPGSITVALENGKNRDLRGIEAEDWFRHMMSSVELDDDAWLFLAICWAGSPEDGSVPRLPVHSDAFFGTFVPDPLTDISIGQRFANVARRRTRCAVRAIAVSIDDPHTWFLYTDIQGRQQPVVEFYPEPESAELDRLAGVAQLHTGPGEVPEETRARTLRLVRALRRTLGNEVDGDADYAGLLRGAAALDMMWRADPAFRDAGPFTLDLLREVGRAYGTTLSGGDVEVKPADYRAALGAAARTAPGTRLSAFVTLPVVAEAAAWAGSTDLTQEAVDALMLSGPDEVGEAERSRMFWARVKTHDLLDRRGTDVAALAARALHLRELPAGAPAYDARLDLLRDLTTTAFASGRDAFDADVLAAFHLETEGAFEAYTDLWSPLHRKQTVGRDFSGDSVDIDISQVQRHNKLMTAPWQGLDDDGKAIPDPYLVRAQWNPQPPERLSLDFGAGPKRARFAELVKLLLIDPGLVSSELSRPLVLDIPDLPYAMKVDLASTLAESLGRTVWYTDAWTDTTGTDPAGNHVLTSHRTGTRVPAWHRARPTAGFVQARPGGLPFLPRTNGGTGSDSAKRPTRTRPAGNGPGGPSSHDPARTEPTESTPLVPVAPLAPAAPLVTGTTAGTTAGTSAGTPTGTPGTPPADEPPGSGQQATGELSDIVADFGRGHRGLQGSVHVMPFPEASLNWLHDRLGRAVRTAAQTRATQDTEGTQDPEAQDTVGTEKLGQDIATAYESEELLDALPYVLSSKGMTRRVTFRGREYDVSARLALADPGAAPAMADDVAEGRRVQIDERNRTVVESSDTSGSGNVRNLPFAYGRTWLLQDSRNPAAASQTFTPKFTLTHNQETVVVTIPENFTAMSALAFSSEPSRAYDYGMQWEFKAVPVGGIASTDSAAVWSDVEPSPGRLATWFPHYLTENMPPRAPGAVSPHDIPADPQTLMGELPLYRVDTVRDPDALLDAVLASDELRPHLRRLSEDSVNELRVFLNENNQRTGLPLMVAGAYPSPVLLDRSGEPIGYLEMSALVTALHLEALARSHNVLLESSLVHQIGAKNALSVSNAAKGGFSLTTNFLGDANPDGKFVFGGGYKYQQTRSLNSGGTAYDWFSLLSENHLLVDSDITYRATLVLAKGGRTQPFDVSRPMGQTMRVPSKADAEGVPPEPGKELHLPSELVALRSLGISATPLKVTGTAALFDQLETLLRRNGFLAPSEPQRLDWLNDSAILFAWLANARKLTMARSQIGLRGALGQTMDGGHHLYFDLPFTYDTWRISANLSVDPRTNTYPTHRKNLPGLYSLNANGMSVAGSEGHSSNHSVYGDFSAGLGGETSDDWTVTGGIPYSASGTQQIIGNTAGSSSGFGLDMLTVSAAGLARFDIPATFTMAVFQGNGDTPMTTFRPAHGNIALTVPPSRTLAARPTALAPAGSRPATDDDLRKARMLPDASGARPQGVQLLPAYAHMNLAEGSAALTTAFKQLVTGAQPGHAEPGAFAQIVRRAAERCADVADVLPTAVTWPAGMLKEGAGWLKDMTVGKPMSDAESTAQEVVQNVLSSTALLSRGPQIFRGVYVFDADAAGSLVGTDVQGEVRGYLHGTVYEGPGLPYEDPEANTYIENDLTTTDSSSRGTTFSRSNQLAFSVTGTHSGDGSVTLLGSGGRSSTRSGGESDTDAVFTDRMHSEAHPKDKLHGFRADATYVIALNKGHRNAVANSVGVGPRSAVATAVHVPGAVVFWVSETAVRSDPQLARLAGIAPAQLPMDRLLPPYFARSGGRSLGFGTVPDALPTGGLDDFTLGIRAAVEREAPGSLTPGSGAHVRGLGQRIADVSGVTGLRSLASAGSNHWQRFHIPYRGRTGLYLVEVALNARPAPGTDLRGVHGQLLEWSGQENMLSSAP